MRLVPSTDAERRAAGLCLRCAQPLTRGEQSRGNVRCSRCRRLAGDSAMTPPNDRRQVEVWRTYEGWLRDAVGRDVEVRIRAIRQPGQSLQSALAEVAVLGIEQLERAHARIQRAALSRPDSADSAPDGPEAVEVEAGG